MMPRFMIKRAVYIYTLPCRYRDAVTRRYVSLRCRLLLMALFSLIISQIYLRRRFHCRFDIDAIRRCRDTPFSPRIVSPLIRYLRRRAIIFCLPIFRCDAAAMPIDADYADEAVQRLFACGEGRHYASRRYAFPSRRRFSMMIR